MLFPCQVLNLLAVSLEVKMGFLSYEGDDEVIETAA